MHNSPSSTYDEVRLSAPAAARGTWLRPIEVLTVIYFTLTGLIFVAFRQNLPSWPYHLAIHAAVVIDIILVAWLVRSSANRLVRFIRLWSPLLIFLGAFEEIEAVVHVIVPGWFDALLIGADHALLGTHPTLWLERYANVWLNEYMQFAYTSYFFLMPVVGGVLYYRQQWRSFETLMLSSAVAYYFCYLMFLLFPIEGPYHTFQQLQTVELHGRYFTALINWIEGFGRVHGGAFPSTHVAGSMVALLCAYKFTRHLFWVLLPIVLSLFSATVYGRYHYFSDVLAGALVGSLAVYVGAKIDRRYRAAFAVASSEAFRLK